VEQLGQLVVGLALVVLPAVGDDVEPDPLLVADDRRDGCAVELAGVEARELGGVDALGEHLALHEHRAGEGADVRGRKKNLVALDQHGCTSFC
jgi:hypothetical protein